MTDNGSHVVFDAKLGRLTVSGTQMHHAALLSLANGLCGILGSIDECARVPDLLIPDAYINRPIGYHEAFPGYAMSTDTRVQCPSPVYFEVWLDGQHVDFTRAAEGETVRWIDRSEGVLHRITRWRLKDGRTLKVEACRVVALDGPPCVASRISVTALDFSASAELRLPFGYAGTDVADSAGDPRISGVTKAVWKHTPACGEAADTLFACDPIRLLYRQSVMSGDGRVSWNVGIPVLSGDIGPSQCLSFDRVVAVHCARAPAEPASFPAALPDFDALVEAQSTAMRATEHGAALAIDGDAELASAISFNLVQLIQSASRDQRHSIAAKGLSGEGYEGHYFWDTEAFMLPVLAMQRPDLARILLMYRADRLEQAKAHARQLGHAQGALYPWRTIAGGECSSHYPTGSAQYHINGDIAAALEFLVAATGEEEFLWQTCAEMLFETARIWLDIGHFNDRRGGAFCIFGVTGPDEYSALVDNDFYTNAVARRHLRFAVGTARQMAQQCPDLYTELARKIGLSDAEIAVWESAADAMWLPTDADLGISPQDDSFLSKPLMPAEKTGKGHAPLLLTHHPLTLFRHQICKQGDVIQAIAMDLVALPKSVKEKNFAYYEPITTHDSTLSSVAFAIAAIEVGQFDKALAYHRECAFVDLHNLHGNSFHGLHMAAISGSWLVLVQGWGGMRVAGDMLHFHPVIGESWNSYRFRLQWRSRLIEVRVDRKGASYQLLSGEALQILDHGRPLTIGNDLVVISRPKVRGVIFDLDGVLTDTAEGHFSAWAQLTSIRGLRFDRVKNEELKGVDRASSLRIILNHSDREVSSEVFEAMLAEKNAYYVDRLHDMTSADLFDGVRELFAACRSAGLKIALASASRNARDVIERLGIGDAFDCIADAANIERQKPAPDIFLACAKEMGLAPEECIGVEDARAGIVAIKAAGMVAIGVGDAQELAGADFHISSVDKLTVEQILNIGQLH